MHLENVADLIVGLYLEIIDFDGELVCSMRKLRDPVLVEAVLVRGLPYTI